MLIDQLDTSIWRNTEGLITEFQCVTVGYGISGNFLVIITHTVNLLVTLAPFSHTSDYDS